MKWMLSEGPNILFFSAWPMLAACVTLYVLRDFDTMCAHKPKP